MPEISNGKVHDEGLTLLLYKIAIVEVHTPLLLVMNQDSAGGRCPIRFISM